MRRSPATKNKVSKCNARPANNEASYRWSQRNTGRETPILDRPCLRHPVELKVNCPDLELSRDQFVRTFVCKLLADAGQEVNRRDIQNLCHPIIFVSLSSWSFAEVIANAYPAVRITPT